jgi:hypothetical protein
MIGRVQLLRSTSATHLRQTPSAYSPRPLRPPTQSTSPVALHGRARGVSGQLSLAQQLQLSLVGAVAHRLLLADGATH